MKYRLLLAILLTCHCSIFSQGFIPPTKGKAVVYFVRVHPYHASVPFNFFDSDTLIADFPSRNYFRYECQPGKHLFWASSDNNDFVPADLKANETYIVLAIPVQGNGLLKVSLTPLHLKHKEIHKAKHIINTKAPVVEDPVKMRGENQRMRVFIDRVMKEYRVNHSEPELLLTQESAIPIEKMK